MMEQICMFMQTELVITSYSIHYTKLYELLNGVEATKKIHNKFPDIKIIALTSYETKPFVLNMIQEGASSYLVKNTSPKEMIKTINEVIAKGFYYNDMVMEIIYEGISSGNKKVKCNIEEDYLTSREKEVLKLICMQHNTSEIAEKLFISPSRITSYNVCYTKLLRY